MDTDPQETTEQPQDTTEQPKEPEQMKTDEPVAEVRYKPWKGLSC